MRFLRWVLDCINPEERVKEPIVFSQVCRTLRNTLLATSIIGIFASKNRRKRKTVSKSCLQTKSSLRPVSIPNRIRSSQLLHTTHFLRSRASKAIISPCAVSTVHVYTTAGIRYTFDGTRVYIPQNTLFCTSCWYTAKDRIVWLFY